MIAGFFIIYPLFARTISALGSESAKRQLDLSMPYWLSNESDRSTWREDKSRQFDQFNHLVCVTMLPVPREYLTGAAPLNDRCLMISGLPEAELLAAVWRELNDHRDLNVAGWCIRDQIWPRLLNRSLCLDVTVPDWAKPNLSRKWLDVEMDDLSMMYSCGVYDKFRPLPRLHDALSFWLNREFPDEDMLMLRAETEPNNPENMATACLYAKGMAEALRRYLTP